MYLKWINELQSDDCHMQPILTIIAKQSSHIDRLEENYRYDYSYIHIIYSPTYPSVKTDDMHHYWQWQWDCWWEKLFNNEYTIEASVGYICTIGATSWATFGIPVKRLNITIYPILYHRWFWNVTAETSLKPVWTATFLRTIFYWHVIWYILWYLIIERDFECLALADSTLILLYRLYFLCIITHSKFQRNDLYIKNVHAAFTLVRKIMAA